MPWLEGQVNLGGFLGVSKEKNRGFSKIIAKFKVKGDLSAKQLEDFAQFSPVRSMLATATPIEIKVTKL